MATQENDLLQQARTTAQMAAQWLQLLQFAAHKGAPVFSPSLCHYHDMLDPAASDVARLKSCCRVALKSETRRVRLHFLPLIVRFDCHRAYASCTPLRDVINRSEQTLLLLEGAQ